MRPALFVGFGVLLFLPPSVAGQVRPRSPLTKDSGVIMLDGPSFMGDLGAERIPGIQVGGPGSLCLADTGWIAVARLQKLRGVATSTDEDGVQGRQVLGHLPRVDSADVRLVADTTFCRRANEEVSRIYDWTKSQPLYLARAGPWYVAFPPTVRLGEWGVAVYLDGDFKAVALSVW